MRIGASSWYVPLVWGALGVLGVILVVSAVASVQWPYVHDSPLMLYAGWWLAQGAVPYRDLFDMNMPGTYFVMWVLGSTFGWSNTGVRTFDLLCVATVALATFAWLRRLGSPPAVAGALLFPLWYLALGPSTSMQREFLALVPLSVALALADSRLSAVIRITASGLLAGAAALIKPQFLVLSLAPLVYLLTSLPAAENRARMASLMAAAVAVPFAAAFGFLAYRGGLDAFFDIALNYWPLYTHLTGDHRTISGTDRLLYLARSTVAGLWNPLVPLAIGGLLAVIRERRHAATVWTIAAMLVASAAYPALSGQFWSYHWLPFQFVLLCASALNLPAAAPARWTTAMALRTVAAAITLVFVGVVAVNTLAGALTGDPANEVVRSRARAQGVPREIAEFLREHLRPGDLVQPLDWTGGAVHGMLDARAPIATRFMYDFHFYHHVDTAYTKRLRRQFLRQLVTTRPRFVIQVFGGRPWPGGPGTSRDFPLLEQLLTSDYRVVEEGETYRILELNAPGAEQSAPGRPVATE